MSTIVATIVAAVTSTITTDGGPMEPVLDVHHNPTLDMTVPASAAMALEEQLLAGTASAMVASGLETAHSSPEQIEASTASPEEEAALAALVDQGVVESVPLMEIDGPAVGNVAIVVAEIVRLDPDSELSTQEVVEEVLAIVVRAENAPETVA